MITLSKEALEGVFDKIYFDITTMMHTRNYRKALEEIKKNEKILLINPNSWRMKELQVIIHTKIIQRKINKYDKPSTKNVDKWLTSTEELVDSIAKSFKITNQLQFEALIRCKLNLIYTHACYNFKERNIGACIGFLAFAHSLITLAADYCIVPETYSIATKVYQFLTNLLLGDNDYQSALKFIQLGMSLSYRELFLRTDSKSRLAAESRTEKHKLNKTFTNLIVSHFHLANLQELCQNFKVASELYKSAKWFCDKFVGDKEELCKLVGDVKKRTEMIITLKAKMKNIVEEMREMKLKKEMEKLVPKDHFHPKEHLKLIEILEKVPFETFKFESNFSMEGQSVLRNKVLNHVKLINSLSSANFIEFLNKLSDLSLSKVDKEVKEAIEKKLSSINTQNIVLEKKIKQKETAKRDSVRTNSTLVNNIESTPQASPKMKGSRFLNSANSSPMKKNKMQKAKYNPKTPAVEKFNYEKIIFKPSYQKKKDYLDSCLRRELRLQKNILKVKRNERGVITPFDEESVRKRAVTTKKLAFSVNYDFDEKEKLNVKKEREFNFVQNCLLLGLNERKLAKYSELKEDKKRKWVEEKEKKNTKTFKWNDNNVDYMNKLNNKQLVQLDEELNLFATLEKKSKSKPRLHKKLPLLRDDTVEHFIKKDNFENSVRSDDLK